MRKFIPGALILALLASPVVADATTTLKIATIAPDGSSWMRIMREGAERIGQRSDGRVQIKFYGGGVMGNDKKVLRKMRSNQLQGGAFTLGALAERYPGANLYSLPLLFDSMQEVDYVRERWDQRLVAGLEEAGLVSFGAADGGFARIMANSPVRSVEDLKGRKIWVPEGDRISYAAMEALGLAPVTLPITDVLTGLQTGLIDIVATSPVGALVFQWHTKLKYITDLPLAYIAATMVIERRAFDALSAIDQAIVREEMSDIYAQLDRENRVEDAQAMRALLASGLERVEPAADQLPAWRARVATANREQGASGAFDVAMLDAIEQDLVTFRNGARTAGGPESP